jgi:hypothetical protein
MAISSERKQTYDVGDELARRQAIRDEFHRQMELIIAGLPNRHRRPMETPASLSTEGKSEARSMRAARWFRGITSLATRLRVYLTTSGGPSARSVAHHRVIHAGRS